MSSSITSQRTACPSWCADPGSVDCEDGTHCRADTVSLHTTIGKRREIETGMGRELGDDRTRGLAADETHSVFVGVGPRGGQLQYAYLTLDEADVLAERIDDLVTDARFDGRALAHSGPAHGGKAAAWCDPEHCDDSHDMCSSRAWVVRGGRRHVQVIARRVGDGHIVEIATGNAFDYYEAELTVDRAKRLRDALDAAIRAVKEDEC